MECVEQIVLIERRDLLPIITFVFRVTKSDMNCDWRRERGRHKERQEGIRNRWKCEDRSAETSDFFIKLRKQFGDFVFCFIV